jgi:hypothetical protein
MRQAEKSFIMSAISSSNNRFAFQAPKAVAFGGASSANPLTAKQIFTGALSGAAHVLTTSKQPRKLDLMA